MDSFAPIDSRLIDEPLPANVLINGHSGYPDAMQALDTIDVMKGACGAAAQDFPDKLWIEPRDWADKARDNDKYHTWPINFIDRFTNQPPTHECTCHALRAVAECCRNRQRGIIFPDGPKKDYRYADSALGSVWLSPLSIYAEANPGQWGGAGCYQVLEIACRRGFLPDKTQPFDYKLKHTLVGTAGAGNNNQSHGNWVRLADFPEGWEDTAAYFKPQEVIFTTEWEQAVCLILHGYAIEYGRSGHAIPPSIWNVKDSVAGYVDSYNVVRYDSLGTFKGAVRSGAFTIASMTPPNGADWLNPTGATAA